MARKKATPRVKRVRTKVDPAENLASMYAQAIEDDRRARAFGQAAAYSQTLGDIQARRPAANEPAAIRELREGRKRDIMKRVLKLRNEREQRAVAQAREAGQAAAQQAMRTGETAGRRSVAKRLRSGSRPIFGGGRASGIRRIGRFARQNPIKAAGGGALIAYALSKIIPSGQQGAEQPPPEDALSQILEMGRGNPRIAEMVLRNPIYAQGLSPVQLAEMIQIAPPRRSDPELIDERRKWDIELAKLKVVEALNRITGSDSTYGNKFSREFSSIPFGG